MSPERSGSAQRDRRCQDGIGALVVSRLDQHAACVAEEVLEPDVVLLHVAAGPMGGQINGGGQRRRTVSQRMNLTEIEIRQRDGVSMGPVLALTLLAFKDGLGQWVTVHGIRVQMGGESEIVVHRSVVRAEIHSGEPHFRRRCMAVIGTALTRGIALDEVVFGTPGGHEWFHLGKLIMDEGYEPLVSKASSVPELHKGLPWPTSSADTRHLCYIRMGGCSWQDPVDDLVDRAGGSAGRAPPCRSHA